MVEEYDSIAKNSAWEIVPTPVDKSVVGSRWIYKVKQAIDGSVEKYKAGFVVLGFSQIEGIDYNETFAPVARYSSIRSIFALSTQMGWRIHQMDVKTAFLNGIIEEEVYIENPEGFEIFSNESYVCRLKRVFYGLKQAPRAWYTRIDNYFTGLGFTKSEADANLYQIVVEGKILIIVLYVDDLILTGDEQLVHSCKEDVAKEFEMKDMGLLHYFLGLEIWQQDGEIFVSQGKYAREILGKFHMEGCKPMDTPLPGNWRKEDATYGEVVDATVYRQLVGSLMYLVNTSYVVNQLSQAMIKPTKIFWKEGKHVLRYPRGTSEYGLWYRQTNEVNLHGFMDVDWVGSPTDKKSTSGGIFSIGSTTVSWYNRKQRSVALSSAEAEYMAASQDECEAIWMRKILVGLFGSHLDLTSDNQSYIKLSINPMFHDRSKHIDIQYHHIRYCVQRKIMLLQYIPTKDQDVDILMKALTRRKFEYHRDRIEVKDSVELQSTQVN
jgi:hypothetical protein